jgi:hypothetical protein
MAKPKTPTIPRGKAELLAALRGHLALLKEYSTRAFIGREELFLGEVAGKLRVLVYESRTNTPLLLTLMDQFKIDVPCFLNKPRGQLKISLREYLGRMAVAINTPTRGLVEISHMKFLGTWAQQQGASHEDWEIDEEFALVRSQGLTVMGLQASSRLLKCIADSVLIVGEKFLESLSTSTVVPSTTSDGAET